MKRYLPIKISILMVFLSVLIALYISYSLFEVHRIIVISYDTNLKDLDILAGQNLLFMDTERLEKDLLVKNMVIKKIRLEKRYVNTIIVQTELR
ncbi:MAG: FtsQ-type POTRA domain-containing protein, partial [Patescibacteria group bacterium]|nr:FtsQ-type POTRA domain-containing protein [Patescibacteria group bacterium]